MKDLRPRFFSALGRSPTAEEFELFANVAWELAMPRGLFGLPRIAANLPEILDSWKKCFELPLPDDSCVRNWLPIAKLALLDSNFTRSIPEAEFSDDDPLDDRVLNPSHLHGILISHPVWAALWYSSGSGGRGAINVERAIAYRQIQGIFLASQVHLSQTGRRLERPQRWYQASLLLRTIHQPVCGEDLDAWSKAAPRTVRAAYQYFARRHDAFEKPCNKIEQRQKQGYGALADILNEAFELHLPSVFEDRGDGKAKPRQRSRDDDADFDLIRSDHSYFWIYLTNEGYRPGEPYRPIRSVVSLPGKEFRAELERQGLAPNEFAKVVEVQIAPEDLIDPTDSKSQWPGALPPLGTLFIAVQARARAERMQAQRLITRLGRIRTPILARILRTMDRIYGDAASEMTAAPTSRVLELDSYQRTLRLVAVSLFLGTPPDQAKQLVVVNGLRNWAHLEAFAGLVFDAKKGLWFRPCLLPDRKRLSEQGREYLLSTIDWVAVSDHWGLGSRMTSTIGKHAEVTAFPHHIDEYRRLFECIRPAFEKAGVPSEYCQLDSFGALLQGWFDGRQEGDQLRTAMVFGRRDSAAETHRYYTALSWQNLDSYFSEGLNELRQALVAERANPEERLFDFSRGSPVPPPNRYCGDERVPDRRAVLKLMGELNSRLSGVPDFSDPEVLNLATSHLAFVMSLVTGFRQFRTPIPDLRLLSRRTGLLSLMEKECADGAHARGVLIPSMLVEQIDRYLELLRYFWATTRYLGNPELTVPVNKFRDSSRFNGEEYELSLLNTFVLFKRCAHDPNWHPVELQGETLAEELNALVPDHWPVINGGRHFLRSTLVEMGCPAVLINAHFGHWDSGHSPWDPESAFDPLHYRRAIEPYLVKILDEIGFEPIFYLPI